MPLDTKGLSDRVRMQSGQTNRDLAAKIRQMAEDFEPVDQSATLAALRGTNMLASLEPDRGARLSSRNAGLQQLLATLPQIMVQTAMNREVAKQQQAQLNIGQQYLQDRLSRLASSGDAQAQFIRNLIPSAPEQFRGILEYDAQNRADYGRRLADSLLGAFMAAPTVSAYQSQLGQQGRSLSQGPSNVSLQELLRG